MQSGAPACGPALSSHDFQSPFTWAQQVAPAPRGCYGRFHNGRIHIPHQRSFTLQRKRLISLTVAALIASMTAATAIAVAAGSLTGAGSTLVAPLMAHWQTDFQSRTGVSVTYGAVGSGTGIADITSRSVDFGASDAPLTQSQASACNGCVQIPWGLTATAVAINVNGLRSIHLTGQVVAKIYLGQITNWNSPQIKKLNKHTNLPSLPITVVYRSDGRLVCLFSFLI